MRSFIRMLGDQSGASAAEYALILAIVGSALAVAAITLGGTISGAMNAAGSRNHRLPRRHLLSLWAGSGTARVGPQPRLRA